MEHVVKFGESLYTDSKKTMFVLLGSFVTSYFAYSSFRRHLRVAELRQRIALRNESREQGFQRVESFWRRATSAQKTRRDAILALPLTQLHESLQAEIFTALEVVRAFQSRAVEATRKTNCVTEMVAEAEVWAAELDGLDGATVERPPLFGLPFSVKECLDMVGYDSTAGFAAELGNPAKKVADICATLRQLGAIPICRTNIPQALLSFSCSNPIYGITRNPYNPESGGSSGGEAALLALGGAVFGIGSDVGGSIRIPAHYCGIAGLKPSERRVGQLGSTRGNFRPLIVSCSVGPMSRDVHILALVMRHVTTKLAYDRDPYVAPIPWRPGRFIGEEQDSLRIGVCTHDGFFAPTPAVVRAVSLARNALQARGHRFVEFVPPRMGEAFQLLITCLTTDGGVKLGLKLADDILDPMLAWQYPLFRLSVPTKRVLGLLLWPFVPRLSASLRALPLSTFELRETYGRLQSYRLEFMDAWKAAGLDALLCPVHVSPALPHDAPMKLVSTISYTALYNALDFPAGSVPVTRVTAEDERRTEDEYPTDDAMDRIVKDANVQGSQNLPVGVQCIALPFEEEIVLRLMNEIQLSMKEQGS